LGLGLGCSGAERKGALRQRRPGELRRPPRCAAQGGSLVVCPTTVLHQWAAEIASKTTAAAGLDVHIYHGKGVQAARFGCSWELAGALGSSRKLPRALGRAPGRPRP
jgi:hypothetical protein